MSPFGHLPMPNVQPQPLCVQVQLDLFGVTIYEPSLIPMSMLAAYIGITYGRKIFQQTNVRSHLTYGMSFFLYACMMSDAGVAHCLEGMSNTWTALMFWLIDASLTSCVALSFAFNGLVDAGWISEDSKATHTSMLIVYVSTFAAWMVAFTYQYEGMFEVLYYYVIAGACGTYSVGEIAYLVRQKTHPGLAWAGFAALTGAMGLYASWNNSDWLCSHVSPYLSNEFWWWVFSNVAMYCNYRYWDANQGNKQKPVEYLNVQYSQMQQLEQ